MSGLLIAVPVLPLLAGPLSLLFGSRLPWRGGELIVAATALSLAAPMLLMGEHQGLDGTWFESGGVPPDGGPPPRRPPFFAAGGGAPAPPFFGGLHPGGLNRGPRPPPPLP